MNIKKVLDTIIQKNEKWSDPEYCLAAVRRNGYALRYIEKQTSEICLAAVQENGWALQYVREQTPEICAAAIKQDPSSVEYVVLPSEPDKREQFLRELAMRLAQ